MMNERFPRRAAWLFGIAIPLALAVVALAPVPFMRGLGLVALVCAALGVLVNTAALRAARRAAYWPVAETIAAADTAAPPTLATADTAGAAPRHRPPRVEPRLALARMVSMPRSLAYFPGGLPARMTSHA